MIKTFSIPDVPSRLPANTTSGSSPDEAKPPLQQYGYNEISEKQISPLVRFQSYFWGPIPWMIELAVAYYAVSITGRIWGLFSCSWW
jgi:H+-transporting ATPase